jgi:hypothetical protein
MEKIILVTKTKEGGGYQARLFGKNPPVQCFAETEIQALTFLVEKLTAMNDKFIISASLGSKLPLGKGK